MSESRNELRRRMIEAQGDSDEKRGSILRDLDNIYDDPKTAYREMLRFRSGQKALVEKLENNPAFFGTMKGHLGSESGLLRGGKERNIAKDLAKSLPAKVQAAIACDNRYLDVKRAFLEAGGSLSEGRSKGKDGIDFP